MTLQLIKTIVNLCFIPLSLIIFLTIIYNILFNDRIVLLNILGLSLLALIIMIIFRYILSLIIWNSSYMFSK